MLADATANANVSLAVMGSEVYTSEGPIRCRDCSNAKLRRN